MKKLFGSLFVLLMIGAMLVPAAALAAPSFTYTVDDQGPDDEPGQKDLTAQSSDEDAGVFYTSWKWDDTSWSGNNTGDGCSLFDTDVPGNDLTDYALCATVAGGKGPAVVTLSSFILYSCNDTRPDRCAGPTPLVSKTGAAAQTYCTITDSDSPAFASGGTDTTIVCNISAIALEADPPITVTGQGTLLNTCSYPSREPNSDPSDCVLTFTPPTVTDTNTLPTGTPGAFTATLNDSASVSPAAAGTVNFKLFLIDADPLTADCNAAEQVFTSGALALVAGSANTTHNVSVAGTYEWTADFVPTDPSDFVASSSTCGEETVVVAAPTVTIP